MKLIEMTQVSDELAEMVALFRVELHSYKGIASKPNIEAGREETEGYLSANFPVFAALVNDEYAGYVVCRIDSEVVWVESIFVKEEYRRQGVATALHSKAEEIAASYGNDTVYNYVHPNNHRMIEFLKKRGYTVLNLIEIRKPYKDEKLTQTIVVGEHEFDYWLEIHFGEIDTAISVMREVAAWGRERGYRVWLDEWLIKEELITLDVKPENFYIGTIDREIACAFILRWADTSYWLNAPK